MQAPFRCPATTVAPRSGQRIQRAWGRTEEGSAVAARLGRPNCPNTLMPQPPQVQAPRVRPTEVASPRWLQPLAAVPLSLHHAAPPCHTTMSLASATHCGASDIASARSSSWSDRSSQPCPHAGHPPPPCSAQKATLHVNVQCGHTCPTTPAAAAAAAATAAAAAAAAVQRQRKNWHICARKYCG